MVTKLAWTETVAHIPAKIEVGRTAIKEERNGAEGRAGKEEFVCPKTFNCAMEAQKA